MNRDLVCPFCFTSISDIEECAIVDLTDPDAVHHDPNWSSRVRRALRPKRFHPSDFGLNAVWRCPNVRCQRPLPRGFEDLRLVSIALTGAPGSSKTHYLTTLLKEIVRTQALQDWGIERVLADPGSRTDKRFDHDMYSPMFRERTTIRRTDAEVSKRNPEDSAHLNPFVLELSARAGSGASSCLLLLYDIAGESLSDRGQRIEFAPYVHQADGIIYLVDPLGLPEVETWVTDLPDGNGLKQTLVEEARGQENQADILTGLNVELRQNAKSSAARIDTPLAVVLAKADLLVEYFEDVRWMLQGSEKPVAPEFFAPLAGGGSIWSGSDVACQQTVRRILEGTGAHDILAAADAFDPLFLRSCAAIGTIPRNREIESLKPWRCLDPLVDVLTAAKVLPVTPSDG